MRQRLAKILLLAILTGCAFSDGNEFPVRVYISSRQQLKQVKEIVSYIEDYSPFTGEMKIYTDDDGLHKLEMLGYNPVQLVDTSAQNAEYSITHPGEVLYHDYSELTIWAHTIAESFPTIVRLDSLGPSVEGRWLWALNITDNPELDEAEPCFVYISTMHGDEPVGTELLIWLCDSLTQRYGSDARLTRIVDSLNLSVVPMINPDSNAYARRTNANYIDLNRNFPVPDGVIGEDGTFSTEPETDAMMDFLLQRAKCWTANFHTGAVCVNYPWDFDTVRSSENELLINRSLAYSSRNPTMYYGAFPQGITNGFDWYEVDGSMQDWDYHTSGTPHLTIELNDVKWPPDTELPDIWADNYDAMVHLMELALSGIHGFVVDSLTGEPVSAQIWFDQMRIRITNEMPLGDFHKQVLSGNYSITVVADGYYPKRITDIYIPHDSASIWLTVQLARADTVFFSDLEENDGGLYTVSFDWYQNWEWGAPSFSSGSGPGYIPSGSKLWATNLEGNYSDSSQSRLVLDIDLTGKTKAALVYDEWYRFQGVNWSSSSPVAHDGGQIRIATSTDTSIVRPTYGYNCVASEWNTLIPEGDSLLADDEPGTPWHRTVVFLDEFCGQNISILWDFGSSTRNTQLGWYIDDIAVLSPGSSLAVQTKARNSPQRTSISISPNPFNSKCEIAIGGGFAGDRGTVQISDLSGRTVRKFTITPGVTTRVDWDASLLPSGVYFITLQNSRGKCDVKKAVLIR